MEKALGKADGILRNGSLVAAAAAGLWKGHAWLLILASLK